MVLPLIYAPDPWTIPAITQRFYGNWTPANLAPETLYAWWDAADTSTLTIDGNGRVASWNSKATAYPGSASQVSTTLRPYWSVTARNSLPGIIFPSNPGNLSLHIPTSIANAVQQRKTNYGITLAAQAYRENHNPLGREGLFGFGTFNQPNNYIGITSTDRRPLLDIYYDHVDGTYQDSRFSWAGTDLGLVGQLGPIGTGKGLLVTNGNTPLVYNITATLIYNPNAGLIGQGLNPFFGIAQELIVTSHTVDDVNVRRLIEGYLAWKWGREASLPANHPYKLRPPLISDPS